MTLRSFLVALVTCLGGSPEASHAQPTEGDPLQVVVFAGQSNMLGRHTGTRDLPARDRVPTPGCALFESGTWRDYSDGKTIGPEAGFVRQYQLVTGRPVGVIKLAERGASLASNWNPKRGGGLFDELAKKVEAAREDRDVEVIGILWMQGEADSKSKSHAKAYKRDLKKFIGAARKEFEAKSAPFVAGRVNPPESDYPFRDLVREGIEDCKDRGYGWIDCDDLQLQEDELHLTSVAIVELGRRMADEVCYLRSEGPLGKKSSARHGELVPYLFVNIDGILRHRPRAVDEVPGLGPRLQKALEAETLDELTSELGSAIASIDAAPKPSVARRASLADVRAVLASLSKGQADLSNLPIHRRVIDGGAGSEPELRGLPGVRYRP